MTGSSGERAPSAFTPILADLVQRLPGAQAAVLVDQDGEAVDQAGLLNPFETCLAGAYMQILWRHVARAAGARDALLLRAERKSFLVAALPQNYGLVVVFGPRSGSLGGRALAVCRRALSEEASWNDPPPFADAWRSVAVDVDGAGRPIALRERERVHPFEVLGTFLGRNGNERGYRVATESGEHTLVCEAGRQWYAEGASQDELEGQGRRGPSDR